MEIKDLDLERYVIVYDIGKSEYSNGMTIVGKVIELEFDDYDKNKAVIESMQNEYEITDDNEFEFWTKSIEDKTESLSESFNSRLRKNIEAQNEYLNSLVKPNQSNDLQQRKRGELNINIGMETESNNTVNHPPHYNYGEIEVIDFIEQVTQHYNANVAYHIGNAIKYLARSPHKNGKEDVAKAKWYIERAYENWDVK
ncbi:DUF3310 domain-containing protein [Staphylococcus succinus]|uniref:DUF3310 domain-containing protein n=1 Tax=Staphylococcus succinus TaxID=61015 RepID=UPI000A6BA12A